MTFSKNRRKSKKLGEGFSGLSPIGEGFLFSPKTFSYRRKSNFKFLPLLNERCHINQRKTQDFFYCCCRHCHQEPENLDHVLRYNHTIGQEFRNALPHKFVNYKKEKTLQHCKSLSSLQRWVRAAKHRWNRHGQVEPYKN